MVGVKGQIQQRGVETRSAIVDAAIELLTRQGYEQTTITQVAQQVGIAPGGVIHHFGSKFGLFKAVIERLEGDNREAFYAMAELGGLAMLRTFARWGETRPPGDGTMRAVMMITAHRVSDDPASAFLQQQRREARELIQKGLQVGIDSGELRPDFDAETKAAEIQAFFVGTLSLAWNDRMVSAKAMFRNYFADLIASLKAPATPANGKQRRGK